MNRVTSGIALSLIVQLNLSNVYSLLFSNYIYKKITILNASIIIFLTIVGSCA